MKKTLSILLLLGCMTMLCAQGRINVKYHGVEYSNGDTIRIELAADASSCEELSFHNISNSRIEDMVITLDSISEAGIHIWALCTGDQCIESLTSTPIAIGPRGSYNEFTIDLMVSSSVPEPSAIYRMRFGNIDGEDTVILIFYVPSSGIASAHAEGVSVYPNPASGQVTVTGDVQPTDILSVYDLQGREVIRRQVGTGHGIALDGLSAGVYVYRVVGSHGTTPMQKLVVK